MRSRPSASPINSLVRRSIDQGSAARPPELGAAGNLAVGVVAAPARANVPVAYDWNAAPPTEERASFIEWMQTNRGETPTFLGMRWDRYKRLLARRDIWQKRNIRAFLMTPREEFIPASYHNRAYEGIFVNIGW
jgi:protein-L-isoaspartate(D-aspartate) O-methyltransferase